MADSFWLEDENSNKFIIDTNILKVSFGGFQRDYRVIDYVGATGGQIRGFGVPGPRKFKLSRKEKIEPGDMNFWNSRRDEFNKFMTKARYIDMWLYIRNGEDTRTTRSLCYPKGAGDDAFDFFHITRMKGFDFLLPEGVHSNIVASTDTEAITGSATQQLAVTNAGSYEAPIQLKYTPTGDEQLFQVQIGDQYGIKLERLNFVAGKEIIYDTFDGSMTIGGVEVLSSQFRTAGTPFNLPVGDSVLNITCSGPGSFSYSYNERTV